MPVDVLQKKLNRMHKAYSTAREEARALPKVPRILLEPNYINPITLQFPKGSVIVYEITNRRTGRKDYFDKNTFWKLAKRAQDNYGMLIADPKKSLGFKNPLTRTNVYPRNVRRVTVAAKKKTPSPTTAAKRIQAAVRARKRSPPKKPKSIVNKRKSKSLKK